MAWSVRYDPSLGGSGATAGATIFWDIPTQNVDNSSLTDLNRFDIYRGAGLVAFGSCSLYDSVGPASSEYTDNAPLAGNATYFVVAYDDDEDASTAAGPIYKTN